MEGEEILHTFKSCTFVATDDVRHCESFTLALPIDLYEYFPFFTSFLACVQVFFRKKKATQRL